MSIFRIYPSKSNTIASGTFKNLNSGQNAVSELWYGGGKDITTSRKRNSYSRLLLYFDITELIKKINQFEINENLNPTYKLKLINSTPSDEVLEKEFEYEVLNKKIATSFDLLCFPINKSWDEGRGYDLISEKWLVKQYGNPLVSGASNWNYATNSVTWDEGGVYTNPTASTSYTSLCHFDLGNEDAEFDITNIVENWLSGGSENNGIAVSYSREFELISGNTRCVTSFFTEKTNTSYKPYIEVSYNQNILDDRLQVSNNRPSKLFFYSFSGHNPTNLYNFSAVTVDIKKGNTYIYSGLTPTHLSNGCYYVEVLMSGATAGEIYNDIWNNVSFSQYDTQNITQEFQIKDNYYTRYSPGLNEYSISIYGIENNDEIRQDEIVRVFCDIRTNYSTFNVAQSYTLEYQMIMNNQTEVIPWTSVNQVVWDDCKNNYFDLDTSWLLNNQTYQIFFRISEMGTHRVLPESIHFHVIKPF